MTLTLDRRQFLTGVLGGGVATGLVRFTGLGSLLSMAEASAATVPRNGPFVLCTLYGGNDGLNTVIPYESGIYRDWRQSLAIPGEQVLPLGDDGSGQLGLPPLPGRAALALEAGKGRRHQRGRVPQAQLQSLRLSDHLADGPPLGRPRRRLARPLARRHRHRPVPGPLGRPDPPARPGRLQTASQLGGGLHLGRRSAPGPEPRLHRRLQAAHEQLPGRARPPGRPGQLGRQPHEGREHGGERAQPRATVRRRRQGATRGDIGTQLDIVAELINYGLPTSVYSVSWASFDTHSNQANTHAGMLASLDAAVSGFMSAFPKAAPGKSPVIVICSEFGRTPRVERQPGDGPQLGQRRARRRAGREGRLLRGYAQLHQARPVREPDLHDGLPPRLRHRARADPRHRVTVAHPRRRLPADQLPVASDLR